MSNDMIIRINDDDGNALEEYRFDPRRFITAEAMLAERQTGQTWASLMVGINVGQITAIHTIVWLLRKRNDPKLKPTDVVFNAGMVEVVDPDSDERYEGGQDEDEDLIEYQERPREDEAPKPSAGPTPNTPAPVASS